MVWHVALKKCPHAWCALSHLWNWQMVSFLISVWRITGFSLEIDVYHRYLREGKKRRIKVWECRSCLLHTGANKKKLNRFPEESCFLTRINFIATYSCAYTKFKCIADRWDSAIKMSSMASNRWYSLTLSESAFVCLFNRILFGKKLLAMSLPPRIIWVHHTIYFVQVQFSKIHAHHCIYSANWLL